MNQETTPQRIALGKLTLTQERGRLYVHHSALKEAFEIDAESLRRWLLRLLREKVAA